MADAENILNEDDFVGDNVDTPEKSVEQHRKRENFKGAISKGKVLGGKKQWTHERVDKPSDNAVNIPYAEYKQCLLNVENEKLEMP